MKADEFTTWLEDGCPIVEVDKYTMGLTARGNAITCAWEFLFKCSAPNKPMLMERREDIPQTVYEYRCDAGAEGVAKRLRVPVHIAAAAMSDGEALWEVTLEEALSLFIHSSVWKRELAKDEVLGDEMRERDAETRAEGKALVDPDDPIAARHHKCTELHGESCPCEPCRVAKLATRGLHDRARTKEAARALYETCDKFKGEIWSGTLRVAIENELARVIHNLEAQRFIPEGVTAKLVYTGGSDGHCIGEDGYLVEISPPGTGIEEEWAVLREAVEKERHAKWGEKRIPIEVLEPLAEG